MTVEELIKKYKSMIELLEKEKAKDKGLWVGPLSVRQNAYGDILEDLSDLKIIEHNQRVKIPNFVAYYIECQRNGEWSNALIISSFATKDNGEKLSNWFWDGNSETLFNALAYGYEVEEEPKYYVEEPLTGQFLVRDGNLSGGYRWADGFTTSSESYSEREIKSIDERYWPFAVPVEKEAAE